MSHALLALDRDIELEEPLVVLKPLARAVVHGEPDSAVQRSHHQRARGLLRRDASCICSGIVVPERFHYNRERRPILLRKGKPHYFGCPSSRQTDLDVFASLNSSFKQVTGKNVGSFLQKNGESTFTHGETTNC